VIQRILPIVVENNVSGVKCTPPKCPGDQLVTVFVDETFNAPDFSARNGGSMNAIIELLLLAVGDVGFPPLALAGAT